MLVFISSFAILDRRLAVTGRETYDCIMSLQNTSNHFNNCNNSSGCQMGEYSQLLTTST